MSRHRIPDQPPPSTGWAPPWDLRPMPFWHINGELTRDEIFRQMRDARDRAGFAGVAVLPLTARPNRTGTTPAFPSDDYFDRYGDVLDAAGELGMRVILYDDVDFPSGMAGGLLEQLHAEHARKRLDMVEKRIVWPQRYRDAVPGGELMAAVAMDADTLERVDLRPFIRDGVVDWPAPKADWRIMYFTLVPGSTHTPHLVVDYLDPNAVDCAIGLMHDRFAEHFGEAFGKTIQLVFLDDVGFFRQPRAWTGRFNDAFRDMHGFDPEPYYPALWHDIGPQTAAIRHAFFVTRAELLAEGYPRRVSQWAAAHGLKDTGHPPGNYNPSPVDMCGDVFRFYRHMAVPLLDCLFYHGYGQGGFKLISSAADCYDRPVVAAEAFGAFSEDAVDPAMLYRGTMELFTRGVNFIIPHGMWYDPANVAIPPLISPYSDKLAPSLPAYCDYVGRACELLQGGRRVADIGVLQPFEELCAWYRFERPDPLRQGHDVSPITDYLRISDRLTRDLHRDFTFIHPELFVEDRYAIRDGAIHLLNDENAQRYRALIVTGCSIIADATLAKVRTFYEQGGIVVATTCLPHRSTALGRDHAVVEHIREMFGVDPSTTPSPTQPITRTHDRGGRAVFIPADEAHTLGDVLDRHLPHPDVVIAHPPPPTDDPGHLSCIHKVRDDGHVYFFANSSDTPVDTPVLLRSHMQLRQRDPHRGATTDPAELTHTDYAGQPYTRIGLRLAPASSVFFTQ